MKQLYKVPFECSSERVKEQRFNYANVGVQYYSLFYEIIVLNIFNEVSVRTWSTQ